MSTSSRVHDECTTLERRFLDFDVQEEGACGLLGVLREGVPELKEVGPGALEGWSGDLHRLMKTLCCTPGKSNAMWQGCVKNLVSQGYVPLLGAAARKQPVDDELAKLLAEHLQMLQRFGCDVSDIISRKELREDPKLVHYGLANAVWTGITGVWASIPVMLEDALGCYGISKASTCGIILDCLKDTVDMAKEGHLEDKACKKLVQFWLSNFGRLVKGSPGTVEGVLEPFWTWVVDYVSMVHVDDDMLRFVVRALVSCLNQVDRSVIESRFVRPVTARMRTGWTNSNHVRMVVCYILTQSERFDKHLYAPMVPLFESVLEGSVTSRMQSCSDLEMAVAAIFEFISASIDVDIHGTGIDAIHTIVGYSFCPHPVLEEILCRVCMDLMVCSGLSFQYTCASLIRDALLNNASHSLSFIDHGYLSASLEQGCALLASALSCALPSTVERLLQDAATTLERQHNAISLWGVAEVDLIIRCVNISTQGLGSTGQALVQRIMAWLRMACGALSSSRWREENTCLLVWLSKLLYQILEYSCRHPQGMSKTIIDAQTCLGILKRMCTSSPSKGHIVACNLQRSESLINSKTDTRRKFSPPGTLASHDQPHLDFSIKQNTAGWLLDMLRVSPDQCSISSLKSIFTQVFESSESYPLQYLAMKSYLEYISECPEQDITRVLPDSFVTAQDITQPFKDRLQKYLLVGKWDLDEEAEDNGVLFAQKTSILSDISSTLGSKALTKPPCKRPQSKSDSQNIPDAIQILLKEASASIKGLADALDSSTCPLSSPNKRALQRFWSTFEEMDQNMARVKKARI